MKNSEEGKKLNEIYEQYANGDDYALAEAVHLLRKKIEISARCLEISSGIPTEEFNSAITCAIWNAFANFKKDGDGCFTSYLNKAASCRIINVLKRAEGTYAKHVTLSSLESLYGDEDYAVHDVIEYRDGIATASSSLSYVTDDHFESIADASSNVEATVIDRMMVEEQRELIDYLNDQAPEHVRVYIEEMYECGGVRFNPMKKQDPNKSKQEELEEKSLRQIANKYGVHPYKVSRAYKSLRGFYDPKKFGDINDYLFRVGEIFPRY